MPFDRYSYGFSRSIPTKIRLALILSWIASPSVDVCHSFVPQPVAERRRPYDATRSLGRFGSARAIPEVEPLVPEENPYTDPEAVSLTGVRHDDVLQAIHHLFPPNELDERNALSRSDGYWPFVQKGKDAPKHFTYGEFDFFFFAQLLDRARGYYENGNHDGNAEKVNDATWADKVFLDIGSGTGRLVFSAAGLHPDWRLCRGIEVLPNIHQAAIDNLSLCRSLPHAEIEKDDSGYEEDPMSEIDDTEKTNGDIDSDVREETESDIWDQYEYFIMSGGTEESADSKDWRLPLAPMDFVCGSFEDPYVYLGDADCIFIFSSCMPREMVDSLAKSIGRQCRPGTIVITTEYMLPLEGFIEPFEDDSRVSSGSFQLSLMEKVDGWCWLTGGNSTAFIHKVIESQWSEGQMPLKPRELSLEEKAYRAIKLAEDQQDYKRFLVGVYNNMVFAGIPERFWPKIDNRFGD
jgi:hypothetical protein